MRLFCASHPHQRLRPPHRFQCTIRHLPLIPLYLIMSVFRMRPNPLAPRDLSEFAVEVFWRIRRIENASTPQLLDRMSELSATLDWPPVAQRLFSGRLGRDVVQGIPGRGIPVDSMPTPILTV